MRQTILINAISWGLNGLLKRVKARKGKVDFVKAYAMIDFAAKILGEIKKELQKMEVGQ